MSDNNLNWDDYHNEEAVKASLAANFSAEMLPAEMLEEEIDTRRYWS